MTRPNVLANSTPLFCDLYHLTMAQAWFIDGKANETKTSECFFRKCPFKGSYLLSAGLAEFAEWLENWHFSDEDIKYLQKQTNADGSKRFNDDFLDFIKTQKLQIDIDAIEEGEVVFPNEPIYSITGPTWQVDMVEAALLNIFNSQSLIATKSSRIVQAASSDGKYRPVLEFGVRRGQELGGFTSTRACFIGYNHQRTATGAGIISADFQRIGQNCTGKPGIAPCFCHFGDPTFIKGPQHNIVAVFAQADGQGSAPGTAADNSNFH